MRFLYFACSILSLHEKSGVQPSILHVPRYQGSHMTTLCFSNLLHSVDLYTENRWIEQQQVQKIFCTKANLNLSLYLPQLIVHNINFLTSENDFGNLLAYILFFPPKRSLYSYFMITARTSNVCIF